MSSATTVRDHKAQRSIRELADGTARDHEDRERNRESFRGHLEPG
jgi:hypothetical protein